MKQTNTHDANHQAPNVEWVGAEASSGAVTILDVADARRDRIHFEVAAYLAENVPAGTVEGRLNQIGDDVSEIIADHLPLGNRLTLKGFDDNDHGLALIVDNIFDVREGRLPDTPVAGAPDEYSGVIRANDAVLAGLTHMMGQTITATGGENGGHAFRNVVPAIGQENQLSSQGSDVTFGWHSDQFGGPMSGASLGSLVPDYLNFAVLRNREKAATKLLFNEQVLAELPGWVSQSLEQPDFVLGVPVSNSYSVDTAERRNMRIIDDDCGYAFIRYDQQGMMKDELSPMSLKALGAFESVLSLQQPSVIINSRPGQFLAIKQRRMLHRRDAFKPRQPLMGARWLRRAYGVICEETRDA